MSASALMVELEVIDDAARWDGLLAGVGFSPWQQSRAYGAALAHEGRSVIRLRLHAAAETLGIVQVAGRLAARGRLGAWHALGGPLWRGGVSDTAKTAALDALVRALAGPLRPLMVTPAAPPGRVRPALEAAGLRRVMTGYTTAVLPVAASAARQATRLHRSWRGALAQSHKAPKTVICHDARGDLPALDAALAAHERERRCRGYAAASQQLLAAAARRGPALLATSSDAAGCHAFMLVFVHGATATYQAGWTDPVGRAGRAHHRLLWELLGALRARGVRLLDLGGLNLPPGIVHFKLATGAVPRTFAGTYVAGAGLRARARCPSRESRANSRGDNSAGRRAPLFEARRSSACAVARAG